MAELNDVSENDVSSDRLCVLRQNKCNVLILYRSLKNKMATCGSTGAEGGAFNEESQIGLEHKSTCKILWLSVQCRTRRYSSRHL